MSKISFDMFELDPKTKSPDWYWNFNKPTFTDIDELLFERLADRLRENNEVRNEGETYEALVNPEEAKRNMLTTTVERDVLTLRVLDSWADIIKIPDLHKYPKLNLMAQLLWVSKFDLDGFNLYTPSYGEPEVGGTANMTAHMSHVPKERAFEHMGGIDNVIVPDFKNVGAYAKYLWVVKEIKNFLTKTGISLTVGASSCPDPAGVGIVIFGPERMKRIAKEDPDLFHKTLKIGYQYALNFSNALYEAGADYVWHCAHLNDVDYDSIKNYGYEKYSVDLYNATKIFAGPIGTLTPKHAEIFANFPTTGISLEDNVNFVEDMKILINHGVYATSILDTKVASGGTPEEINNEIKWKYKTARDLGRNEFNMTAEFKEFMIPMERVQLVLEALREGSRAFVQKTLQ